MCIPVTLPPSPHGMVSNPGADFGTTGLGPWPSVLGTALSYGSDTGPLCSLQSPGSWKCPSGSRHHPSETCLRGHRRQKDPGLQHSRSQPRFSLLVLGTPVLSREHQSLLRPALLLSLLCGAPAQSHGRSDLPTAAVSGVSSGPPEPWPLPAPGQA